MSDFEECMKFAAMPMRVWCMTVLGVNAFLDQVCMESIEILGGCVVWTV